LKSSSQLAYPQDYFRLPARTQRKTERLFGH